jgi:putative phosphoribosyl transferase
MFEARFELEGTASSPIFRDRTDAGRQLAELLALYAGQPDVLVLALPRGGVPVAAEVARALAVPFDVFPVRKLGVPGVPEMAMGALAPSGVVVLTDYVIQYLGVPPHVVERVMAREARELARRERTYQRGRPAPEVRGRTVIVVDDGLAMGASLRAAALALRRQEPKRIVAAVPVAWRSSCAELQHDLDELVAVAALEPLHTVSHWYQDFTPITDAEVCALLGVAQSMPPGRDEGTDSDGGLASTVSIPVGAAAIQGDLRLPMGAESVVVFAHGSGSSRRSYRNRFTAGVLEEEGFGTLVLDLLTAKEQSEDAATTRLRFDVGLLAERLGSSIDWLLVHGPLASPVLALVGASTGAAAALMAAAERVGVVRVIVSRGGRPDLAGPALSRVRAPTLLIVGGLDGEVLALNQAAMAQMRGEVRLAIIPGAGHVFEEPGTLGEAARLTTEWLRRWLPAGRR